MAQAAIDEIQERISEIVKVCGSFLYFLSAYCWIEDKITGTAIPFKLWQSQMEVLPKLLYAFRLIILKARQLGLTWMCAALALWLAITRPLQLIIVISAKEDWAVEFLDRVKFIMARLPEWMVPEVDKSNNQHLRFLHEDGLFSDIKSLATTVEGAQGKTPTLFIGDETARNRYIRQIWANSKPGLDAGGGRAIFISNAVKDGVGWGWTRDMFVRSMQEERDAGESAIERIFMPWWDRPDRPKDFKERQIREGMDPVDFSQHYPETEEEAISALLGSYFGPVLARHATPIKGIVCSLSMADGEVDFEADKRGILEVWRFPYDLVRGWNLKEWRNRYAIGSDVSEGLGQSYSVAYVIDRVHDELACRLRSNRLDAVEWAYRLYMLSLWYKGALIAVERTGAGQTTVKELSKVNANQYVRQVSGKIGSGLTKEFGWNESHQAKHELCGDLKQWLKVTAGNVHCPILINECSTYIRHENGVLDPEDDTKFGDCVIGAGLTVQSSQALPKAEEIEPPPGGWLEREREGGKSAWAR